MKKAYNIALLITVLVMVSASQGIAQWNWSMDPTVNNAITTATAAQSAAQMVTDGSGGAIICWNDNRSGDYDIYAQRIDSLGHIKWTADGVGVCVVASTNSLTPSIATDGSGGAIIAWTDQRSGNSDIYAQRINGSGVVQWTSNGVAVCTQTGTQLGCKIVSDGSHGADIVWQDSRSGTYDIYAQRLNSSGAAQWTADGVLICGATGVQNVPAITKDGSGGAIISWQDARNSNNDVYAQRISSAGSVQWTADGVAVCTEGTTQINSQLLGDGSGGAIVVWQDNRAGSSDINIYAQRLNSSGAVQWTADGVAICNSANNQTLPVITSDGSTGAIMAWQDNRGTDQDIYAQHVNVSGTAQWTSNGVAVCSATGSQSGQALIPDGSNGAVIAWADSRTGTGDIYAQRLNSSGTAQWTANGFGVCTATGVQQSPLLVSVGSGADVVMAWYDNRSGDANVYSSRLGNNGSLPIELAMFDAAESVPGTVSVEWSTVTEQDNLGFYVERRGGNDPKFTTVSTLIVGAGTSLEGHSYSWTDNVLNPGNYTYRLKQMDQSGGIVYSSEIVVTVAAVLGVGESTQPQRFALAQNYPNPFNPTTVIRYALPASAHVTLKIYNMLGQLVSTLVDGQQEAGFQSVQWAAPNQASGLYLYKITAGAFSDVKRMMLLK